MNTWPVRDVVEHISHLPNDSATAREQLGDLADWSQDAANTADLLDLATYWLNSEYAKWTLDPDDKAAKRERDRRKRDGIKPPPFPIIEPVAARPPSIAAQRRELYEQLMARYGQNGKPPVDEHGVPLTKGKHLVDSDSFDAALGI